MKRATIVSPLAENGGTAIKARIAVRLGVKPRCEARLRGGNAWCQSTDLLPNGRCRFHGGASTGPRTAEGKARALAALKGINARRKVR
ncbi:MAG: HGGxSTG domain-containing protein [Steroidobacteraceae bacterium]